MAFQLQVGNVGSLIRMTVVDQDGEPVDVSAATLTLYLRRPDDSVLVKTPTLTSGGVDGRIQYATVANDLIKPGGPYSLQVKVVIGGNTYFSTILILQISPNIFP